MARLATSRSLWSLIVAETLCLLGAEVARFGISVWIYEETRSVGAFSLLLLANLVPGLLAHPIAGSVVDRSSRKAVMIGASLVSLAGTAIVLAGALLGSLSMTLVVVGAGLASIADSFQWPALAASVPLMASDAELPKYNGLIESGRAIGRFAGPAIGGLAIAFIGVTGLVAIEAITFVIATAVVAAIAIPRPGDGEAEDEGSLWSDMSLGFRWIFAAKPLLKFLLVATFANFFLAICEVVLQPYGLSFLSERSYGIANAMFGAGMIVGGLLSGPLSSRMTNLAQCLLAAVGVGATFIGFGFCRGVIGYAALNLVDADGRRPDDAGRVRARRADHRQPDAVGVSAHRRQPHVGGAADRRDGRAVRDHGRGDDRRVLARRDGRRHSLAIARARRRRSPASVKRLFLFRRRHCIAAAAARVHALRVVAELRDRREQRIFVEEAVEPRAVRQVVGPLVDVELRVLPPAR
jgi:MFS family permease